MSSVAHDISPIHIDVAGLSVSLYCRDIPEIIGFYPQIAAPAKPDIRIDLEIIPGFEMEPTEGDVYPAFVTDEYSDHHLCLHRIGARGRFDIAPDGTIVATFRAQPSPTGLEAIVRIGACLAFPSLDTLILHSSAVADSRGAAVFSGVSGAGKSTISTMLAEHCEVEKFSDELLLVRKIAGQWMVEISPFAGSGGLEHGIRSPLSSINLLVQAPEHRRTKITAAAAMDEMCRHVVTYARAPQTMNKVLDLIGDMVSCTPCYRLEFKKHHSVSEVLGITCSATRL